MKLHIPTGYKPVLDVRDTERAIGGIKRHFECRLSAELSLERASAPLFVRGGTGINDDLNGVERKVAFEIRDIPGVRAEGLNSLAKWKRMALARYGIEEGKGIWTDMNAIRPDEELDSIHSVYVDQWDWERVITPAQYNEDFLRFVVNKIYKALRSTEEAVYANHEAIKPILPETIAFVTTNELEDRHPHLGRKERENLVASEAKAFFLMKIGHKLKDGKPHDGRAPDYDNWDLNGDIIVWNPVLQSAFELSSMGIRVDKEALVRQLELSGNTGRLKLEFHAKLMNEGLPLSIGGGIGQSRLCMFLLRKAHIGEVQASIWPSEMEAELARHGVVLL
jgi:aspartate--ammonia ligase